MVEERKSEIINKLTKIIFYVSIVVIMVGFNFQDRQTGWFVQYTPTGGRIIQDIKFLDTLNGFAITNPGTNADTGYYLKTTNGGLNWIINNRIPANFCCLSIKENNVAYISGSNSSGGIVLKTTNNGDNWFNTNFPSGNPTLERCFFVNKDTGWVCANYPSFGGIWRTTDGGLSWQMQAGGEITAVFFIDNNTGWYSQGNGSGTLFKTTNTGNNWVNIGYFTGQILDIFFINNYTGWMTGAGVTNGHLKSFNGGLNWITQSIPVSGSGTRIFFLSNRKGWMTYFQNRILATLDSNIYGIQTTTSYGNIAVIFKDTLVGWLGGTNISKTTDGGGPISSITNNSKQIAKDFILYQNYPNPFNSVSSIKYKVSSHGGSSTFYIEIKVFDIAGKEITILVNKRQNSGEYNVKFYGSNLSSGVYFYSLFVDGVRVDTKKLVLLK